MSVGTEVLVKILEGVGQDVSTVAMYVAILLLPVALVKYIWFSKKGR